uniref:Protochlorophyllide reductase n=1 Tax=Lotharella oceanica TaxID=641309 RepID=A0A7S2U1R6_9EUKA
MPPDPKTLHFVLGGIWALLSIPIHAILVFFGIVTPRKAPAKDLTGKVAIVTGSNCGIGRETAFHLGQMGATVVLACRNPERGEEAERGLVARLKKIPGQHNGHFVFMELDLSDLRSVMKFCECFVKRYGKLDILVNNAGIGHTLTKSATKQGFDLIFGVNYLGHFALTRNLLPLMCSRHQYTGCSQIAEGQARIVNLSSVMHHFGNTNWSECLIPQGPVSSTYCSSKLAMAMLTHAINLRVGDEEKRRGAERAGEKGAEMAGKCPGVRAISANPGAVHSNIWRFCPNLLMPVINFIMMLFFLTNHQGCTTSVACAVGEVPRDEDYLQPYFMPDSWRLPFEVCGPYVGYMGMKPRYPPDIDAEAKRLWKESEVAVRRALLETKSNN